MYQIDEGPCNIGASAVVMWNQNSGGPSLPCILHLSSEKSVNLYILIPQRGAVRVHSLVFPEAFRYCTDRGYLGEQREREHAYVYYSGEGLIFNSAMLPNRSQRLYYQHVSYLWNFVLCCPTLLIGLWFVLQLPGKESFKNKNRKKAG